MIKHRCGATIPADVETYVRHLASCPETHGEIGAWCRAIVNAVEHEAAQNETPTVSRDSTLTGLIADLDNWGPDTPVDLRQPGYALALLVAKADHMDGAEAEYVLGLGEVVFSALTETSRETPTETRDLTPAEMADMHRDGSAMGVSLRDIARLAGVAPETVRRRIAKHKRGES